MNIQSVGSIATLMTALVALLAVYMTYRQERQIGRTMRAQAYLKLAYDWRDPVLHDKVVAVFNLWAKWKEDALKEGKFSGAAEWSKFVDQHARDWVGGRGNQVLSWGDRRAVSQFVAKLGPMITAGYLKDSDVFGVVPEMG
jgi:hypothetical protein